MTKRITVDVPDELGAALAAYHDRLPEILERGLEALRQADEQTPSVRAFQEADAIIRLLAQQPDPQTMIDLQPSPALQERVSELLDRSKTGELPRAEALELERYLTVEHLVRLAKGHAYSRIGRQS